jgi:DmsE family decaheme c-type cytochrome
MYYTNIYGHINSASFKDKAMHFTDHYYRPRAPLLMALGLLLVMMMASGGGVMAAVDDHTCLECHEGIDKTLAGTSHQLSSQITAPAATIACVSCHAGGETHIDDPAADNISNPGAMTRYDAQLACFDCHVAHVGLDNYGFDVHAEQDINCSSCHKVHGGKQRLLLDDGVDFCLACHRDVSMQFMRASNHPVRQGMLTCLDCHRFASKVDDGFAYEQDRICRDCHPQQAGPYPYEHAPVTAYAVNGEGCGDCHNPHGSENNFLLNRPDQHLCRQCHMTPPGHRNNVAHGTAFANYDCVVCHTDIHGSFVNSLYLDPNLEATLGNVLPCYQCHNQIQGGGK